MTDYKKCIVPTCQNPSNIGIPLPPDAQLRQKWLESLDLDEIDTDIDEIICINHFDNGQFLQKDDALFLDDYEKLPVPVNQCEKAAAVEGNRCGNEEIAENHRECRLCSSNVRDAVDIYSKFPEDHKVEIAGLITTCIPALKLSKRDTRTHEICLECYQTITEFYKFRKKCLENDTRTKKRPLYRSSSKSKPANKRFKPIKSGKRFEFDVKFEHVEAQVMEALQSEGAELASAENIIIEIHNNDEQVTKSNVRIVTGGAQQMALPSDVKVNHTKIGLTACETILGVNHTEFCLVGGHVFEYGLCKNHVKQLKCITARCRSHAEQSAPYEVNVLLAHNHQPPTPEEMRKQMFLYEIRKKMQHDKSANFRAVYEEFCLKQPDLGALVTLRNVVNFICGAQAAPRVFFKTFADFYTTIEETSFEKLHFTHTNQQFYQERLRSDDGSALAVVFATRKTIEEYSDSALMYVDASFRIETQEPFDYQLVTVLVWKEQCYHPICYALINRKTKEIYTKLFEYLRHVLAPNLRPTEIVTDFEALLYYALAEVYTDCNIGGSVFYYTLNIYKKLCTLGLSRELESSAAFRHIYQMLLMLPLLPVNTVHDAYEHIKVQAETSELSANVTEPIFAYLQAQWIDGVTPELFCVHHLENRINENVIAPFKKLRDLLMLTRGKSQKQALNIVGVLEKIIDVEEFLRQPHKKSFERDLSTAQKRNVIRAWQFIDDHPKININEFFAKIFGYLKCMENQLWIWGLYRYTGDMQGEELISADNFSIVSEHLEIEKTEFVTTEVIEESPVFLNKSDDAEEMADGDGVQDFLAQIAYGKF